LGGEFFVVENVLIKSHDPDVDWEEAVRYPAFERYSSAYLSELVGVLVYIGLGQFAELPKLVRHLQLNFLLLPPELATAFYYGTSVNYSWPRLLRYFLRRL
jgi:hypothetical protein